MTRLHSKFWACTCKFVLKLLPAAHVCNEAKKCTQHTVKWGTWFKFWAALSSNHPCHSSTQGFDSSNFCSKYIRTIDIERRCSFSDGEHQPTENFEMVCNTNASQCHCLYLTPVHGFILLLAYVLSVWVGPNIISGQPWLLLRADHFLLCSPFCTKPPPPPPLPYSHLIDLLGTAGQLHRSLLHTSIQGEETKIPPFIPICNALRQSSELGSGAFGWMPLNEVSLASSSTPYCQCTFITLIFLPKGKHHVPKIHQFFSKK